MMQSRSALQTIISKNVGRPRNTAALLQPSAAIKPGAKWTLQVWHGKPPCGLPRRHCSRICSLLKRFVQVETVKDVSLQHQATLSRQLGRDDPSHVCALDVEVTIRKPQAAHLPEFAIAIFMIPLYSDETALPMATTLMFTSR